MSAKIVVRPAVTADLPEIYRLLLAFGRHWGNEAWVSGSPDALGAALFGPSARGHGHVAIIGGATVGVALWFLTVNFWRVQPILYLEDLFVDEAARGSGAGEALMRALAAEAVARDCAWMSWAVLTDNLGGKRFYERIGASVQSEWESWAIEGDSLKRLAGG